MYLVHAENYGFKMSADENMITFQNYWNQILNIEHRLTDNVLTTNFMRIATDKENYILVPIYKTRSSQFSLLTISQLCMQLTTKLFLIKTYTHGIKYILEVSRLFYCLHISRHNTEFCHVGICIYSLLFIQTVFQLKNRHRYLLYYY